MRTDDPCRIHEPTLAALDEYTELALDAGEVDAARAHLASCPRCQARRRSWARLDDALRDALAPTAATPALTTADLLATIGADHEPSERRTPMLSVIYVRDEEDMDDEHASATASPATETPTADASKPTFAPLPMLTPHRQPAWRRALTSVAAVGVAAALIASIVGALALTGHLRGAQTSGASKLKSASATQTAQAGQSSPQPVRIAGVAFSSSTDGWVIFQDGNNGIIYHYSNGALSKAFTLPNGGFSTVTLWPFAPNDLWLFMNGGGGAYHYDGSAWTQLILPNPPNAEGVGSPSVMTMVTPTQGWAIGNTFIQSAGAQTFTQVFYHYDGSVWRIDPADSQASVGAPGAAPTPTPLGSQQPASSNQIQLTGISATLGGDVWATGYLQIQDANGNPTSTTSYIYHRVGGVWRLAQTLPNDQISGITMTGAHNGWIIGQSVKVVQEGGNIAPYKVTQTAPIAFEWNGGRWSPAAIPQPDQTQQEMQLNQIAATSPSNVWIAGSANGTSYTAGSPYASDSTYLIHYDGSRWSRVSLPQIAAINPTHDPTAINQLSFQSIALTPSGDLWIAGNLWVGPNYINQSFSLLYHYSGGQWVNIPLPAIKPAGATPSSGSQPAG